jgi:hypothetical protein
MSFSSASAAVRPMHARAGVGKFDSREHLDIGPGTDVPVNSVRFQAAFQVCKSRLSP